MRSSRTLLRPSTTNNIILSMTTHQRRLRRPMWPLLPPPGKRDTNNDFSRRAHAERADCSPGWADVSVWPLYAKHGSGFCASQSGLN